MAAGVSGSVAFTSSGKTLRVYYAQTFTPGVAQSTVTITKVTLQSDVSLGTTRFFFDGRIIVNGEVVFSRSVAGSDGGVTLDGEENIINNCTNGSVTVNHSAATAISIQLEKNTYNWPYFFCAYADDFTLSAGSKSVTLAAIPMASRISAGAVSLGSEMTISLAKAAPGMTDTVTWQCGTQSGTIVQNSTGTTFTWTPPVSLASQAPSGTSVSITLTTATKNGNTSAGSSSVTVSCPIPASVKPTASLAVSDETGYLGSFGSYIRSQSKARVKTTAAGVYGSTITGISVTCGTLTGSGESLLFALPNAGTVTVSVTVTDSRGRTAATSAEIFVADYSPPVPGITALYRCDASGNAAADGAWAKAALTCAVTSLDGKNAAACVLKYRVRGTESWTEKAVTVPGSAVFPAETGSDYQVLLTAADSFTAANSDAALLPAAFALLDFDRKNKAVGIGQRAGTANTVSLGLPIKMGGNRITDLGYPEVATDAARVDWVCANVGIIAYPVGAIYISVNSTSPASLFGGTWERIYARFLLAADSVWTAGSTGGEAAHALSVSEIANHRHGIKIPHSQSGYGYNMPSSGNYLVWNTGVNWASSPLNGINRTNFASEYEGSGGAHNNMPPYLAVYMWKRVA